MKKNPTRQARSIARIRSDRRKHKLCVECGDPALRKKIASTGKVKVLTRCQRCLGRQLQS